MTVEAGYNYLPEKESMTAAFDRVKRQHPLIANITLAEIRRIPLELLQQAAGDYFTAGVAYLANRGHDKYIQEVGTTMWWAVNRRQVIIAMTDNMIKAAIQLGVPPPQTTKYH